MSSYSVSLMFRSFLTYDIWSTKTLRRLEEARCYLSFKKINLEKKYAGLIIINQKGPNTSMILVLFLLYFRLSPLLLTLFLPKNSLKSLKEVWIDFFVSSLIFVPSHLSFLGTTYLCSKTL